MAHTLYIRRCCVSCINLAISDQVGIEWAHGGPRKSIRCLQIDIVRFRKNVPFGDLPLEISCC